MRLTGSLDEPDLAFLPWDRPLEEWPDDLVVALPRGISRHIVRFVRLHGTVYAVKEVEESYAQREYELLTDLQRRGLPTVEPVGVVLGRVAAVRGGSAEGDDAEGDDAEGDDAEVLPAALITRHLEFSLPYRALFSTSLRMETANRLIDALAVLIVKLHLAGFSWNDCSLSNTLFRRDAGSFAAYLVDAETGELHPRLSDGQRAYDLETAATNVAGELMDLKAGGRLHEGIDPIETGVSVRARYEVLWDEITRPIVITRDDRYPLESRMRVLNALGFDVAELQVTTEADGEHITVAPKVVDSGHHSRRLMQLTGLDVEEHQARRLLNDLDSYRLKLGLPPSDEEIAAHRWVTDRFERVMQEIPMHLRGKLEPAQIFHEVLEHRWFMSERAGASVPFGDAITDYVATILTSKPDEQAVLGARAGTPSDDTAALVLRLPPDADGL